MHGTFEPWTIEEQLRIVALAKQGVPGKLIAEQVGRTYHSVYHRLTRIRDGIPADERKRWSDDMDAQLRALWMRGVGIRPIAAELKVSIGSVAGRLARLKLYRHGDRPAPPPKPRAPKKHKPWSERKHLYNRRKPREIPMAPEPDARNLTLVELEKGDCRYPVTADHPMLFCGQPKADGSSYCAHHHHKCWTPPQARNRDARPR